MASSMPKLQVGKITQYVPGQVFRQASQGARGALSRAVAAWEVPEPSKVPGKNIAIELMERTAAVSCSHR